MMSLMSSFLILPLDKKICPKDFWCLQSLQWIMPMVIHQPLSVGLFFFRWKSNLERKNALKDLTRISDTNIYDVLKISYNELKQEEKSIFLDIACFFKGEDKDYMTMIQDYSDYVDYGVKVLVDKSLITISCCNKLQMHDLLQEMGRLFVKNL